MTKKFTEEEIGCFRLLRENGYAPREIRELLLLESNLEVSKNALYYHTHTEWREYHKERMKKYMENPKVREKLYRAGSIRSAPMKHILCAFIYEEMNAEQLRKEISKKHGIKFLTGFEETIDTHISVFEKQLGEISPIIRTGPYQYKINKESSYAVWCGEQTEE